MGWFIVGTAGVLFGASGLRQQGPGESRQTNQAIHPSEEEEERTEDSDNALTSSHEQVIERLGSQGEVTEELAIAPAPGLVSILPNVMGARVELEEAAQKRFVDIVGDISPDSPAPSPRISC